MKISSFIMFLLLISTVFAVYGMMVKDANKTFATTMPEFSPIVSSNWTSSDQDTVGGGPYDFIDSINGTVGPLMTKFAIIKNEEEGWFSKLTAGITAIPYTILLVPDVLISSISIAGAIVTGFFIALGIPGWFVILIGVIITIWAVFKLLEYYQRVPI